LLDAAIHAVRAGVVGAKAVPPAKPHPLVPRIVAMP
jgi:hypothetical protein